MRVRKIGIFWKETLILLVLYGILFLLIFFSGDLSDGLRQGIQTSLNLVIPSLFLFLIAANFLMHSPFDSWAARPFYWLARLFAIEKQDVLIVVLSLLGGYPVGAKLLGDAVRSNRMPPEKASRMLCYCVNCGPAFLISGVGVAIFHSLQIGLYLYLSQLLAAFCIGCLNAPGQQRRAFPSPMPQPKGEPLRLADTLVGSVTDAIRSMGMICGFVVAFSAFLPFVSLLANEVNPMFACLLQGVMEVTTGCAQLADPDIPNRVLLAAGFTSFGGICVLLQLSAMLRGSGIRMGRFLRFRLLYMAISIGAVWAMLRLTPDVADSLSYRHNLPQAPWSVSPAATFFLLLLSLMLLFFRRKADRIKGK